MRKFRRNLNETASPDNYGGVLFTTESLSNFMRELDTHGIDLHLPNELVDSSRRS